MGGVDGVGSAELGCPFELAGVYVDGDDGVGACEACACDSGIAYAAAAEHRNGVAAGYAAGVDGSAQPRHYAATDESGGGGRSVGVDFDGLAGVHKGEFGESADA